MKKNTCMKYNVIVGCPKKKNDSNMIYGYNPVIDNNIYQHKHDQC